MKPAFQRVQKLTELIEENKSKQVHLFNFVTILVGFEQDLITIGPI